MSGGNNWHKSRSTHISRCFTFKKTKTNDTIGALPELTLALPSQVPHQPVRVEGVLRRHTPAHDGVEEGFPLASVEPQDLVKRRYSLGLNEIAFLRKTCQQKFSF